MITRKDVLSDAIDKCVKDLYSLAQPSVDYDDFMEENKEYLKREKEYYSLPEKDRPPYFEYMGPKPFEFYYLPKKIFKDVADSYVYAYKFDDQQELLDTIKTLKGYCEKPIVDKWIEGKDGFPGHRGYENPDNLEKEIYKYLDSNFTGVEFENAKELTDKFFEFLDMAGKFFNWNRYLNGFNTYVYLGGTPSSNKESVIENWKKYRNKDITINDNEIYEKYYGEDYNGEND